MNTCDHRKYSKQEKIRWVKLSRFSRFSGVPQMFFCEYKCLSLFILNNEYWWLNYCKDISTKTLMALKPRIFTPANLSLSMVVKHWYYIGTNIRYNCHILNWHLCWLTAACLVWNLSVWSDQMSGQNVLLLQYTTYRDVHMSEEPFVQSQFSFLALHWWTTA